MNEANLLAILKGLAGCDDNQIKALNVLLASSPDFTTGQLAKYQTAQAELKSAAELLRHSWL